MTLANEDVAALWHQGLPDGKDVHGSHMFTEGPNLFSYGHHFLLGKRLNSQLFFQCTTSYSVSTSKHQSYVRRVLHTDIMNGRVILFRNHSHRGGQWWDTRAGLPAVGEVLPNVLVSSPTDVTAAVYSVYDHWVDTNNGRIKYSLWNGDAKKLQKLLGEPDPNYCPSMLEDQVFLQFIMAEGLDEAVKYLGTRTTVSEKVARILVDSGAITVPNVGQLRGWYWEAWKDIQNSGGVEEQFKYATDLLIRRKREPDRQAAYDFIKNLNNLKG